MLDFIAVNWAELALALLALVDVVVSLTPSKEDDKWAGYFRIILEAMTGKKSDKKENGK